MVVVGYLVGTLAAVYHLANGIWTFGITWGIWTSERAMRGASYVCLAFGLLLAGVGMSSLAGMKSVNIPEAIEVENRMEYYRKLRRGDPTDARQERADKGIMSESRPSPRGD